MSCGANCEQIFEFFPSYTLSPVKKLLLQQIIASSTGSIIANTVLNPLNVVKVQLQKKTVEQQSITTVIRNIYQQKQLRGFWSGTSTGLLMSVPNSILYMVTYEQLKKVLRQDCNVSPNIVPGVGGFLARAFAVTLISPLELIRTIQSSGIQKDIIHIGSNIVQKEGYVGLYRGWFSTILRDCPFSAMYWFNFELFRPVYSRILSFETNVSDQSPSQMFSPSSTFLSGATSSFIAALVTHPFDVVKTRRQLNTSLSSTTNNISNLKLIIREDGLLGLYKGLSMRLLTVIPGSAILITVYETIKSLHLFE